MPSPVIAPPFDRGTFSLDVSGIAGFFGGEEAFAAMISVHLIPARRWMGWYNSPGSYFVAKKYGTLPNSTFWDGLFPGPAIEPTKLLELDSGVGQRYTGVFSGTQLPSTGHLSYLLSSYCKGHPTSPPPQFLSGKHEVTDNKPNARAPLPKPAQPGHRNITVTIAKFPDFEEWDQYPAVPRKVFATFTWPATFFIILTILFSLASAVLCGLYGDWYSFSMILFGVVANGITCSVLGSGVLQLEFPKPSDKSPPGDGILFDSENIILLQGSERIVSAMMHSRFRLQYANDPTYQKIGLCSIILLAQFLFQLFLIPQGELIGQILFLSTLAMSWICNGYLASFDSEELQTDLLFKLVHGPMLYKFPVDKWSMAVVFTLFYFQPKDPRGILNELMPNNTPAWDLWKQCICASILYNCQPSDMIRGPDKWLDGLLHTDKKDTSAQLKEAFDALLQEDQGFVTEFLHQADSVFNSVPDLKANAKFAKAGHEEHPTKDRGFHKTSAMP